MEPSEYEKLRLKNIEENKKFLAELGFNPYKPLGRVVKKAVKRKRLPSPVKPNKAAKCGDEDDDLDNLGSVRGTRRRSSRIQGKEAQTKEEIQDEVNHLDEDDEDGKTRKRVQPNRPNVYGAIEGVEVGTVWETRMECCHAGIHRPPVCGIHGGLEGAYSIALSGGYEDNIDLGEVFTYTGEGGRDLRGTKSNPKNLRTAPQSKDQVLDRGNLALHTSVSTGRPVRVIRGYKLGSIFRPEYGYRYDGLYKVEKSWYTTGLSGFGVWKFALKRLTDQAPPPWDLLDDIKSESHDSGVESNIGSGRSSPAQDTDTIDHDSDHIEEEENPNGTEDCQDQEKSENTGAYPDKGKSDGTGARPDEEKPGRSSPSQDTDSEDHDSDHIEKEDNPNGTEACQDQEKSENTGAYPDKGKSDSTGAHPDEEKPVDETCNDNCLDGDSPDGNLGTCPVEGKSEAVEGNPNEDSVVTDEKCVDGNDVDSSKDASPEKVKSDCTETDENCIDASCVNNDSADYAEKMEEREAN